MAGLKALGLICASLGVALALSAAACLLPGNDYQRWQLVDGSEVQNLRWAYERIHFDPRPIDVVILGPSKTLLGLSAARIEQRLSASGRSARVANFSIPATGRNVQWSLVDELYKTKSPKVIVIGVDHTPYSFGHPAFKFVAPAEAIISPPAPLLHNFFPDLAYLPARQVKLFGASLAPDLFGLRKRFDPAIYAQTPIDFTTGIISPEGKNINMEREVPAETLLSQIKPIPGTTKIERLLEYCCNDGDDHVYIREIAKQAKLHGTQIIFVFLPTFNGPANIVDREFLEQYGVIVDNGDLSRRSKIFENWSHLNHAGATIASDRVADAIIALKPVTLGQSSLK